MAKILIVEDDAHTVRVMALWLNRHRHEVIEANNGREALALLERHPDDVHLLISDINMPQMNGLEMVRVIRETMNLSLPIMMFSSRCDQEKLAEDMKIYQVKIYPKPFMPSRLCAEIEKILSPSSV